MGPMGSKGTRALWGLWALWAMLPMDPVGPWGPVGSIVPRDDNNYEGNDNCGAHHVVREQVMPIWGGGTPI